LTERGSRFRRNQSARSTPFTWRLHWRPGLALRAWNSSASMIAFAEQGSGWDSAFNQRDVRRLSFAESVRG
jgi:hypothetical protein